MRILTPAFALCLILACDTGRDPAAEAHPEQAETLALVGATIHPSPTHAPIANGVVLIRSGTIAALGPRDDVVIPADAERIACDGMHLFAGFQNSHVHFSEAKWSNVAATSADQLSRQLEEMLLRYGFTTVVDTASDLEQTLALRRRIEAGEVRGPRILTAGSALYPENGLPFYLQDTLPAEVLARLPQPATEEEAVAIVARQIAAGADLVKLFVGSWFEPGKVKLMAPEVARAAARAAHDRGKLVIAHASNIPGLELALESGVDVLAHALDDDRGWNESHPTRMNAGGMAMVPTLKLFGGQPYTKFILLEVQDFVGSGGRILFGTDVGFLTDYDPSEEYRLMADAGIDWRQTVASLTTEPADRFGEGAIRGRVAPGMAADLVVLEADPSTEITALANVKYTVRQGRVVYRAQD